MISSKTLGKIRVLDKRQIYNFRCERPTRNFATSYPLMRKNDSEVYEIIRREEKRQRETLNFIASENFAPPTVLEALSACMSNKYSPGFAQSRDLKGHIHVDEMEDLCKKRSLAAFNLDPSRWGACVQAYSGSNANLAVFSALMNENRRYMALAIPSGGHPSHGFYNKSQNSNIASKFFRPLFYDVDPQTGLIDYQMLDKMAKKYLPKLIVTGASCYPRDIDYKAISETAKSVGAMMMTDIAHTSGLIVSKIMSDPFEYSDVVTTTTHKTLNGPRGAIIYFKKELEDAINFSVYPHLQPGGSQNNKTAAIAIQMGHAATEEFHSYARQVVKNAKTMAAELIRRGFTLSTGGTDSHLLLWNCAKIGISGNAFEIFCEEANIILSKNGMVCDTDRLSQGGLRIGSPAMTSRGMKQNDFVYMTDILSRAIKSALDAQKKCGKNNAVRAFSDKEFLNSHPGFRELKKEVIQFAKRFKTPGIESDVSA